MAREHGAWGILLVPLAAGVSVGLLAGGDGRSFVPFVLAALSLFWLRAPVESWSEAPRFERERQARFRSCGRLSFGWQ